MTVPLVKLTPSDIVEIDRTLWVTVRQTAQETTLRPQSASMSDFDVRHLSRQELLDLYFDNAIDFRIHRAIDGRLPDAVKENLERQLADCLAQDRDTALLRLEYVQACDLEFGSTVRRADRLTKSDAGYAAIADRVARERRTREKEMTGKRSEENVALEFVSGRTLRRWHERWLQSGRSVMSLVPIHQKKGNRNPRLHPVVEDTIRHWVEVKYLTPECPSVKLVHARIAHAVTELNRKRSAEDALAIPSYAAVVRFIEKNCEAYDIMAARKGKKAAAAAFDVSMPSDVPSQPLEVVEIDHTPIDIFVTETGWEFERKNIKDKPLFTIWLTLARCKLTKMIFGFYFSRSVPSWSSVMECLYMGVYPKSVAEYGAETPWPVCGVPQTVVMDNGAEFHSKSLQAAAGQLKFLVQRAPRGKPRSKGLIEASFNKELKEFLRMLPGVRTDHQDSRAAKQRAGMTIETITNLFGRYVTDVIHNRPKGSLKGMSPLQKWNQYDIVARLPPSKEDLVGALGLAVERTVRNVGIEFQGLRYASKELETIRRREGHLGTKLMVRVDPSDLRDILVMDEGGQGRKGRWVCVPCVNHDRSEPISVEVYREALDLARSRTDPGRRVVEETIHRALSEIIDAGTRSGAKPLSLKQLAAGRAWFKTEFSDPKSDISPVDGEMEPDFTTMTAKPENAVNVEIRTDVDIEPERKPLDWE